MTSQKRMMHVGSASLRVLFKQITNLGVAGVSTLQNFCDPLLNWQNFGLISKPQTKQSINARMPQYTIYSIHSLSIPAITFSSRNLLEFKP